MCQCANEFEDHLTYSLIFSCGSPAVEAKRWNYMNTLNGNSKWRQFQFEDGEENVPMC